MTGTTQARPRMAQIEITTICNFRCFYCAGREMPQRHMSTGRFVEILDELPSSITTVSLQGEGEPTAHPGFRDMVEEVRNRGWRPYTITNGSLIRDAAWIAQRFPSIGVSIDTLDPAIAQRIGRFKLPRVLKGVDRLVDTMGAGRIVIHTVAFGQALDELTQWVKRRGFGRHVVQPLQGKPDYASCYTLEVSKPAVRLEYHYRCRYLDENLMLYYSLDGHRMPCAFIKDTTGFVSIDDLRQKLARQEVPVSCTGCRAICSPVATAA
ncbi:MAG: radical SAM protein [Panacagrimonas sp.]